MSNEEALNMLTAFRKEDGITKVFRKLNSEAVDKQKELLDFCIQAIEKQMPTNRQWLNGLSDEDFARFTVYDLPDIGRRYSDSVDGIRQWLKEKHYD